MFSIQSKIKRKYPSPEQSIYSHRFFSDLAFGYSITLGKKGDKWNFLSFEPNECRIKKLLTGQYHNYFSYDIEQIISRIAYKLMAYGKAYLFIHPEYSIKKAEDGTEIKMLSSVKIEEMEGYIKKKTKEEIVFYKKGLHDDVTGIQMQRNLLVIFDIKELGFSRKFFPGVLRKLSKCDVTSDNLDLILNHSDIYDFTYHSERNKIAELKALKGIGWSFGTEKLSDSYLLYKKIQAERLKIKFLKYIVKKTNDGLNDFLGDDAGELVANIIRKDYEQLWNDYTEGKITGTELSTILYRY